MKNYKVPTNNRLENMINEKEYLSQDNLSKVM